MVSQTNAIISLTLSVITLIITLFTITKKISIYQEMIETNNDYNKVIIKAMLVLIDYEITNTNIENLKKTKNELTEFLIKKL